MGHDIFEIVRIVVVIALVVSAAALATPKGRLPLALRGLVKIMRKDCVGSNRTASALAGGGVQPVPAWKRLLAFALVILAAALAVIIV